MPDNIELKLEISFFMDVKEEDLSKIKEQLDNLGWFILQETKLAKIIKEFPGAIETGYDVVVKEIQHE